MKLKSLKMVILKVPEYQLGSLAKDEYYFHEIIGCLVVTDQGEEIGIVKEILTPGANDVWVVKGKGGKEQLIPYIEDVVKEIDVKAKINCYYPTRRTAFVMKIDVLTLFPDMFTGVFGHSILKRALEYEGCFLSSHQFS